MAAMAGREFNVRRLLRITDAALALALLRAEGERSPQAAFLHRLHCVVLVAAGYGCDAVATAFGDDRRSVQRWVRRFEEEGVEGLTDGLRTGRPGKLSEEQLLDLRHVLARPPSAWGQTAAAWSPELLRLEVERRFGVAYSLRQCARLFGRLAPEPAGRQRARPGIAPKSATKLLSKQPSEGGS